MTVPTLHPLILFVQRGASQEREMLQQGFWASLEIHPTTQVTHKGSLTPSVVSAFEIINSF